VPQLLVDDSPTIYELLSFNPDISAIVIIAPVACGKTEHRSFTATKMFSQNCIELREIKKFSVTHHNMAFVNDALNTEGI
jgi:hypothetical protein